MNYHEFLTDVKTHIARTLGSDVKVMVQKITKNNGTQFEGLVIMRPDCNISPTIYLNPYYHRLLDGVPMEEIYTDILSAYRQRVPEQDFDTSFFFQYHKVRPYIIPKLINYEKNREHLKKLPHVRFLDLAVVFQYLIRTAEDEHASILIYNHHLDYWNVTANDLHEAALHNAPLLLPAQFDCLADLLKKNPCSPSSCEPDSSPCKPPAPEHIIPMYVLTNSRRINGASAMLYNGLLQQLSDHFQQNLIILPSSVHEVLIVPSAEEDCSCDTMSHFSDMVREVNETQVADDELLSNHAYLYTKADQSMKIF